MTASTTPGGQFRFGGVAFRWAGFDDEALAGWRLVTADALEGDDLGSSASGFLELAARLTDDDAVRVLSPWSVFHTEFEWPFDAYACDCLQENGFGEVAHTLNGDALVATPGPVFDRFLLKASVLDEVLAAAGADSEVGFNDWAVAVGVDHAYFAPGYPDYSEPTTHLREAGRANQTGEAHEAFLRAFDAYFYGGLPTRLAEATKRAYLRAVEAERGFDYVERDHAAGVTRRLLTVNSLRMRTSVCCTSIEERGAKVFASRLERIAEASSFA